MEKELEIEVPKAYEPPRVLRHERITFETAISGSDPAGHWEFQPSDSGFWMRVWVQD